MEQQLETQNETNIIKMYFNEINDIYKQNDNDYDIEYCSENRDKLIQMNLKSVIHIAKKYVGLGIELEDLISAGNEGLCVAYDKFDPSRNTLKKMVLETLEQKEDTILYEDMSDIFKLISYGALGKRFSQDFKESATYDKNKLIAWVNKNVSSAKFNSVAAWWIRAYILQEIDTNSRVVKKPKLEIYKDKQKNNSYSTEITTELSGLESDENFEYEEATETEIDEAYINFRKNLNYLLSGVCVRDRGVMLKKFGIGYPRPMLPKEIAEQEGLSIARISQIIQNVIKKMMLNANKYNINAEQMYTYMENMEF